MRSRKPFRPVTRCDICGKELTSKESIDRHRGQKCHAEFMEKRVEELEKQVMFLKTAVNILNKRR